jgi:hypothetical protein
VLLVIDVAYAGSLGGHLDRHFRRRSFDGFDGIDIAPDIKAMPLMLIANMQVNGAGSRRPALDSGLRKFVGRDWQCRMVGFGPSRAIWRNHDQDRLFGCHSRVRHSSMSRALRRFKINADTPPRSDSATTRMLSTMNVPAVGLCRNTR